MPSITVNLLAGRSPETKKKLAQAITDTVVAHCDVPRASVSVLFVEYADTDWTIGGRTIAEIKAERDGS